MRSCKAAETGNEPTRRKRGFNGQPQALRRDSSCRFNRPVNAQEPGGQFGRQSLARCGELNVSVKSPKQSLAHVGLERPNVPAHRRL